MPLQLREHCVFQFDDGSYLTAFVDSLLHDKKSRDPGVLEAVRFRHSGID